MIISFKSNGLWPEEEVQVLLKNVKELFVILENLGQTIKSHHGVQDVPIAPPPLTAIEENIPKEVIPEPIFEKEMAEIPVEIHDTVEVVLEEAPQLLSEAEAKANPILVY